VSLLNRLVAENARLREALIAAAEWFEEYAESHQATGAIDKAIHNLKSANACRRAAIAQEPRRAARPDMYEWHGPGPEPARWTAQDGTIVYPYNRRRF
jgi:hypothetical protein